MIGRDVFFRHYANLPVETRNEVILNLEEKEYGPVTWRVAYQEIEAGSDLGNLILEKLIALGFIKASEQNGKDEE